MRRQPGPWAIHYSELPPSPPDKPCAEWETFRREIGKLIAEGHEGKHALIHGDDVLGLFDSHEEALGEGYRRFLLTREPFLVQEIETYQRVVKRSA